MGRSWSYDENELDLWCKKHKVELTIEFNKQKDNHVYVKTIAKIGSRRKTILDIETKYPLNDNEILSLLIQTIRDKKLRSIGI